MEEVTLPTAYELGPFQIIVLHDFVVQFHVTELFGSIDNESLRDSIGKESIIYRPFFNEVNKLRTVFST